MGTLTNNGHIFFFFTVLKGSVLGFMNIFEYIYE